MQNTTDTIAALFANSPFVVAENGLVYEISPLENANKEAAQKEPSFLLTPNAADSNMERENPIYYIIVDDETDTNTYVINLADTDYRYELISPHTLKITDLEGEGSTTLSFLQEANEEQRQLSVEEVMEQAFCLKAENGFLYHVYEKDTDGEGERRLVAVYHDSEEATESAINALPAVSSEDGLVHFINTETADIAHEDGKLLVTTEEGTAVLQPLYRAA